MLDAQGEKAMLLKTESLSGKTESTKEMSVYEHENNNANQTITYAQTEKHIYGSARLGTNNERIPMFQTQNLTYSMRLLTHRIGERSYELSNHLGNVLSVISDKVIPHSNGGNVDYYMADIRQAQDYSPFGVTLQGRNFTQTGNSIPYDYGFNGMIKDDEVKGEGNSYDFGVRILDPRLGRWLSIDPLSKNFPYSSPYVFVKNTPAYFIDPDGKKWVNPYLEAINNERMLEKPDEEKIKRLQILADEVTMQLNTLKANDEELYNYIENVTYNEKQVAVFVYVSEDDSGLGGEKASTNYKIVKKELSDGRTIYSIKGTDNGLSIDGRDDIVAPRQVANVINVLLYRPTLEGPTAAGRDQNLANEAGDVMYVIENVENAFEEGNNDKPLSEGGKGWSYEQFNRTQYSFVVEEIYKSRAKGENITSDAYPLKVDEPAKTYRTNDGSSKFTISPAKEK